MKEPFFAIFLVLIFGSCSNKKIEITSEYIINENWSKKNDEGGGNSMRIDKMKIKKDSTIDFFSEEGQVEILNKLEEDSSFRWFTNIKMPEAKTYKNKKIYFNKDNGFTWLDDVSQKRTTVFGNLEKNQWYRFSHLVTYPYYIYLYIDSTNKIHRFDVNLANY